MSVIDHEMVYPRSIDELGSFHPEAPADAHVNYQAGFDLGRSIKHLAEARSIDTDKAYFSLLHATVWEDTRGSDFFVDGVGEGVNFATQEIEDGVLL